MKVYRHIAPADPYVQSHEHEVLARFPAKPIRSTLTTKELAFVKQAMVQLNRYQGDNPNLTGVKMQAERMGPSWLPSVPVCAMIVEQLDKEKIG